MSGSDDSKDGENGFVRVDYSSNEDSAPHFRHSLSRADRVDKRGNDALLAETSVRDDLDDVKVSEDVGREDTFVDCPDELISFEGRNSAVDNTEAINISEIQQTVEERDDTTETQLVESENQSHIVEREGFVPSYEEERRSLVNEIANLHHLLKGLNEQNSLVNDSDGGPVEVGEKELPVMINECSKLIEHALNERSRTEAILSLKDQEIETLNSRVNEFSGLHDVEASSNRLLTSLANVIYPEELVDESVTGKLYHIEKITSVLIENYNQFLYESDLLRQSLGLDRSDVGGQTVFLTAREELLELKRKEVELSQKISNLEDENGKLLGQINKDRAVLEKENEKLRAEVEQEKNRYGNTKEKLSLAVTKGKALVHQRDSLKQILADKTSELEKCLSDAELNKTELVKSQNSIVSLQEELSQKDKIFEKCKEVLSQSCPIEISESMDVVETVSWLVNKRHFEAAKLQDEINRTKEAAEKEISLLTTSLLEETQEKNYLRDEFEELTRKFEEIVEKENRATLEKDQIVNTLLEASGIEMDGDTGMIVNRCIGKIKEQIVESPQIDMEVFEKIQSLLYVKYQESILSETILEEEMTEKSDELVSISRELSALKDEKATLQTSLERSEEKTGLLREKLTMAVKKGKGLVQDRENQKQLIDEKNGVIEKLKIEIQRHESVSNDHRDQINKLSVDLENLKHLLDEKNIMVETLSFESNEYREQITKLLTDLENSKHILEEKNGIIEKLKVDLEKQESVSNECGDEISKLSTDVENLNQLLEEKDDMIEKLNLELQQRESKNNEFRDQIDKFSIDVERIPYLEADLAAMKGQNDDLERYLMESSGRLQRVIESIDDITLPVGFEEPVEKVKWLKDYVSECQDGKAHVEGELERLKDALLLAENNISILNDEKEEAQISKAATEMELAKKMEEVFAHSNKLSEAQKIIQSFENQMSQVDNNRTGLDSEMNKLREQVDSKASDLEYASSTIKTLEGAISNLVGEKKKAEEEISMLNLRLNACMEELDGKHLKFENRSLELSSHLNSLQLLLKDDNMVSLLSRGFEKKIESLRDVGLLVKDVSERVGEMDSEMHQNYPLAEVVYSAPSPFQGELDYAVNMDMINSEDNAADGDIITLQIGKTLEGLLLKNKILAGNIERSSTFTDEIIAALAEKLQAARDKMIVILENKNSLKLNMNDQENKIKMLENNITNLESELSKTRITCEKSIEERDINQKMVSKLESDLEASQNLCSDTRLKLQDYQAKENKQDIEGMKNELFELASGLENIILKLGGNESVGGQNAVGLTGLLPVLEKLVVGVVMELENSRSKAQELSDKLIGTQNMLDMNHNTISKLEADLEASQNLCSDVRLKLHQAQEDKQETEEMKNELFELASGLENIIQKLGGNELSGGHKSVGLTGLLPVLEKLVVGVVTESENSRSKAQELSDKLIETQKMLDINQKTVSKLETDLEASQNMCSSDMKLKLQDKQEAEEMKNEFFELAYGLENIIQKLGGNELVVGQKSVGLTGLLPVLEKLVVGVITESENSKSKAQELSDKLLGTQKMVNELSSKVKLLEDSKQGKDGSPEIRERGVFEAPSSSTRSEISEIEDTGPLGKIGSSSAQSAAHARMLRKGSTDHLAINVDTESDRLISKEETDEDKGHLFKSLNTSGLVPIQGKMIADRIDGIWVSGGRALMNRPRARLGLIAYWLFLHLWLLGTIL